jgi:hypothetical protein
MVDPTYAKVTDYRIEKRTIIQTLSRVIEQNISTEEIELILNKVDDKYSYLYDLRDFTPTQKDCQFWYGYHQLNAYISGNISLSDIQFTFDLLSEGKCMKVCMYCSPPYNEMEISPKINKREYD